MLLPTALRKSWMYEVLLFIVSRDTLPIGNKFPDREFYWSAEHEFYSRLGIRNCKSVLSVDKLMLLRKSDSSLEIKQFYRRLLFSGKSKSNKKKENLQDKGSDTKFR